MKMYAVLRNDIYMDAGKAAAQAGHAFVHVSMFAQAAYAERFETYMPQGVFSDLGTKVVLGASEKEIKELYDKAVARHYPAWIVVDSGHVFPPDFDGKHEVLTALGIGPLFAEEAESLLGHLKLYKVPPKRKKRKR